MAKKEREKKGMNPNSLKNLKPFSKDNPPKNPGAKKGSMHISTLIKRLLESNEITINPITKKKENLTQAEIMVLEMIVKAKTGDVRAFKELIDRVWGQAEQNVNFQKVSEETQKEAQSEDVSIERATQIYKDIIKS